MNDRDPRFVGVFLDVFRRRRNLGVKSLAQLFGTRLFVKIRTHFANQLLCAVDRIVLGGKRFEWNIKLFDLFDDLRRSDIVIRRQDGGRMKRQNPFRAQSTMISNRRYVFHLDRIRAGKVYADHAVLGPKRPNYLVVDRRDNDNAFRLGIRRRIGKAAGPIR